jgi:hypothetical protein
MALIKVKERGRESINLGRRNLVINGAILLDQRNGGSATTPTADQTVTLDRFKARLNNASKYSVQQVTDAPSGFLKSLKVTSAAATTVGTNDFYQIATPLEGYTTNVLAQGSSTAKQYTISFYVKSSLTGTFGGAYSNDTGDRFYAWTYTIDVANTWERKSITITGATDGTWESTNGSGLHIYWTLGAGSGVQTSAGVWGTSFKRGATGTTNVVATNAATWQITGVQLEVGDTATEFEHRSYGEELALCQRYYQSYGRDTAAPFRINGSGNGGNVMLTGFMYPMEMRATPTINYFGGNTDGGNINVYVGGTTTVVTGANSTDAGKYAVRWNFDGSSSHTDGCYWIDVGTGSTQMGWTLDSEL